MTTNVNRETPIIHLFLPSGKTFTFRDVTIMMDNENMLILKYKAMSDEKPKVITIQKSAIVGWSYVE